MSLVPPLDHVHQRMAQLLFEAAAKDSIAGALPDSAHGQSPSRKAAFSKKSSISSLQNTS